MPNNEIFDDASKKLGHKINPVAKPEVDISIDTSNEFFYDLIEEGKQSKVDITQLNSFTQLSQNRETLYQVLDTMAEDSTISAVLETYAEDATEQNEQGQIVWVESDDSNIAKYVNFLLESLSVDKNVYRWVYSLVKYGDIYLKMFRESDFEDELFKGREDKQKLNEKFEQSQGGQNLEEDVKLKVYSNNDRLVNFVDLVPNPAEMFELTKFGKSYAYIKTNSMPTNIKNDNISMSYYTYKFRRSDVEVHNAVSFVHACLEDDTPRVPEQVQLMMGESDNPETYTYNVRRGQSVLYSTYKIWRQVMLLENAMLLNRLTKSSLLRVLEVEVADMPKEKVGPYLQRVKNLVEQKSSISDGNMMSEYTNPGPIENNIYVPTRQGVGAISTQQIGGDVNVKDIADIDYFKTKLYASLRVPKQFLGDTEDSTGFNGGTSLSIVSSRYAKTVKRIQSAITQMLTDCINIILIDRGLDNYVNKFDLKMQPPTTQEELDKRDAISSKVQLTDDVMRIVSDGVDDDIVRLKIMKSLLSNAITNQDALELLQDYIELKEDELFSSVEEESMDFDDEDMGGSPIGGGMPPRASMGGDMPMSEPPSMGDESPSDSGDETLPSPSDLDVGDFSDMEL